MTPGSPTGRRSTISSTIAVRVGPLARLRMARRPMRVRTMRSTSRSENSLLPALITARAYSSVWRRPGISGEFAADLDPVGFVAVVDQRQQFFAEFGGDTVLADGCAGFS